MQESLVKVQPTLMPQNQPVELVEPITSHTSSLTNGMDMA